MNKSTLCLLISVLGCQTVGDVGSCPRPGDPALEELIRYEVREGCKRLPPALRIPAAFQMCLAATDDAWLAPTRKQDKAGHELAGRIMASGQTPFVQWSLRQLQWCRGLE